MSSSIRLVNRMSEVMNDYDAVIMSFWGVIYDGEKMYPHAAETMQRLRREGKKIIILSNDPSRVKDFADEYAKAGLTPDLYDGILTSGEVVYHEMRAKEQSFFRSLGTCYYYIGRSRRRDNWVDLGYIPVDSLQEAEFVIVTGTENSADSVDRYLPILRDAAGLALPMVCVDPDRNIALPALNELCAGALAYRYEMMGGLVLYRGKPQVDMFDYCLEGLVGLDKKRVLVVGDNFATDIKGAADAGLDSILIAAGTHARELGISLAQTLSLSNVEELSRLFGAFPSYAAAEFKY